MSIFRKSAYKRLQEAVEDSQKKIQAIQMLKRSVGKRSKIYYTIKREYQINTILEIIFAMALIGGIGWMLKSGILVRRGDFYRTIIYMGGYFAILFVSFLILKNKFCDNWNTYFEWYKLKMGEYGRTDELTAKDVKAFAKYLPCFVADRLIDERKE